MCINLSKATVSVLDPMVRQYQDQDDLDVQGQFYRKNLGPINFLLKRCGVCCKEIA